jgi:Spy/CpxP family protein refolding chaperone
MPSCGTGYLVMQQCVIVEKSPEYVEVASLVSEFTKSQWTDCDKPRGGGVNTIRRWGYLPSNYLDRSPTMMRKMSLLAATTFLCALPLAAQQPGGMGGMMRGQGMRGAMMPGMDSMMAPMMRSMAFSPGHLLSQKAALHLTGEQETRLTALRDAAKSAHDAAAGQAKMHLGEMEEVMHAAAPDTAAVKHHFDAAHRFMGEAMWAMMRSAAQARAILTDGQRQQVQAMADSMAAHPMQGGMQHP